MNSLFKTVLLLDQWDQLNMTECEDVAHELGKHLSGPFRFHKVSTYILGQQKHTVALFEWNGPPEGYDHSFFVLIPGGKATLGYDRAHPFLPNQMQQESWNQHTEQMVGKTLDNYLDLVMTPIRQVTIEPFLLEVLAHPLAPPPTFNETLGPKGGWERHPTPIFPEKIIERISRWGFRFPTSDEWEYACAAGSRSLFRWGNDTPDYPIPRIGTPECHQWDKHLQQNAFGLFIARNPYHWEFCKEQEMMRGGDGGNAWQAGAGTFVTWLTLASAFFQKVEQKERPVYGVYLRRAFSLNL